MVTISYPRQDVTRYAWDGGAMLGPFNSSGQRPLENLTFGSPTDVFYEERMNVFHENGVLHEKLEGNLLVDSKPRIVTPAPTLLYPDRCTISKDPSGVYTLPYGVIGQGTGRETCGSNDPRPFRQYSYQSTGNGWVKLVVQIYMSGSNQIVNGFYRYTYTVLSGTSASISCSQLYETWSASWYVAPGVNWYDKQSFSTIESVLNTLHANHTPTRSTSTVSFTLYSTLMAASSPAAALDVAKMKLAQFFLKDSYLPEEKDYGDLAMTASEQVNTTHINVIAFLRDLRHPTELIPKLKNLRSLKGLSDNFLTVKYGILPTISDLRNILGAFGRIRPSLDRNGFTTYYASHQVSKAVDLSTTIEVEQHIKLGVGNEDNAFEALETGLERIGLFPSLQNIWDLVPYSFVVDWFLNIGDFLERVDAGQRLMRFNVRYATMSRKQTTKMVVTATSTSPVSGNLSLVRYHRWVTDQAPVPPLSLLPSHQGSSHWLEATALIVQRRK